MSDDLEPYVEIVEQPDGVIVEGEPFPILTQHA
jgi:hypothetical protein